MEGGNCAQFCIKIWGDRSPCIGGMKYRGEGGIGDFRRTSPFISETVRDRQMVAMER